MKMRRWIVIAMLALLAVSGFAQAAKPATIKIAVMAPLTGNLANIGEQFRQGAELKAKQVNAAGGIDGKDRKSVV